MRLRLFWKILWGFWVTWILTTVVTLSLFLVLTPEARTLLNPGRAFAQVKQVRDRQLNIALKYGGERTLNELLAVLPAADRAKIKVVDTPQGKRVVDNLEAVRPPSLIWPVPWPWAIQLIASLIFSATLAAVLEGDVQLALALVLHPLDRLFGVQDHPRFGREQQEDAHGHHEGGDPHHEEAEHDLPEQAQSHAGALSR